MAVEQCVDCGHTWGVTMPPRSDVRCTSCASPRAWRDPVRYWESRTTQLHWPPLPGTPEYLDARLSAHELRLAVTCAGGDPTPWRGGSPLFRRERAELEDLTHHVVL